MLLTRNIAVPKIRRIHKQLRQETSESKKPELIRFFCVAFVW